jgi:hypothetical protein
MNYVVGFWFSTAGAAMSIVAATNAATEVFAHPIATILIGRGGGIARSARTRGDRNPFCTHWRRATLSLLRPAEAGGRTR